MDSLVGYGSDDEHDNDRYGGHHSSGAGRRRDDDTNYEEVNMDMSEDSQGQESEPELPPAERPNDRTVSGKDAADSRDRERPRGGSRDRRERRRDSPRRERERERRSPRRDDRANRPDRPERSRFEGSRRGLLGDRPDDRTDKKQEVSKVDRPAASASQPPALMDLKFGDGAGARAHDAGARSHDARDAVSPRFVDRDRRDKDRGSRERERDRDNREGRYARRDDDRRSREPRDARAVRERPEERPHPAGRERPEERPRAAGRERHEERPRPRPAGAFPPPPTHTAGSSGYSEQRPPSGDYKPSYKVNRKLEVMEKMGLQIKTPDGSMATAQQLRAAAHEPGAPTSLPPYYNPQAHKILDQVAKRKLLWAHKKEEKSVAEQAAPWTGTRFAADQDGRQASKFMRLMGIRDPDAAKQEPPQKEVDPIKKQEELFQAMQAQYEVARATTHTMRGVGLGFQRGQY